jgi:hypothetical protein
MNYENLKSQESERVKEGMRFIFQKKTFVVIRKGDDTCFCLSEDNSCFIYMPFYKM